MWCPKELEPCVLVRKGIYGTLLGTKVISRTRHFAVRLIWEWIIYFNETCHHGLLPASPADTQSVKTPDGVIPYLTVLHRLSLLAEWRECLSESALPCRVWLLPSSPDSSQSKAPFSLCTSVTRNFSFRTTSPPPLGAPTLGPELTLQNLSKFPSSKSE